MYIDIYSWMRNAHQNRLIYGRSGIFAVIQIVYRQWQYNKYSAWDVPSIFRAALLAVAMGPIKAELAWFTFICMRIYDVLGERICEECHILGYSDISSHYFFTLMLPRYRRRVSVYSICYGHKSWGREKGTVIWPTKWKNIALELIEFFGYHI